MLLPGIVIFALLALKDNLVIRLFYYLCLCFTMALAVSYMEKRTFFRLKFCSALSIVTLIITASVQGHMTFSILIIQPIVIFAPSGILIKRIKYSYFWLISIYLFRVMCFIICWIISSSLSPYFVEFCEMIFNISLSHNAGRGAVDPLYFGHPIRFTYGTYWTLFSILLSDYIVRWCLAKRNILER